MPRRLPLLLALVAACSSEPDPPPVEIVVPAGFTVGWEALPHRISVLELTLDLTVPGPVVRAEIHGGSFDALDRPSFTYRYRRAVAPGLTAYAGSTDLEIAPAPDPLAPGAFRAEAQVRVPRAALPEAAAVAALLRGFRIDTDRYAEPPSFETNPELPYDPAQGYTSGGLALELTQPYREGEEWVLTVAARNRLALADRADMNAAIPQARTWVRVDWLLVGAPGAAVVRTAAAAYTLGWPDYGRDTPHPHASHEEQAVAFDLPPGTAPAAAGLAAFDIAVNLPGRHDPGCNVVQDAINAWGEPVSGPGRYLRELTVSLDDLAFDPAAGRATAHLDLYFSNRSSFKEIGNLCLGLTGTAALLAAPGARATGESEAGARFRAGEPFLLPLSP